MKIVMVINSELPPGLIANTAAVLGISLGRGREDIVGGDIKDADGNLHPGITARTVPVLAGSRDQIKSLRDNLFAPEYAAVSVVDFSEIAQRCLDYDTYTQMMSGLDSAEIYYHGVCLCGPAKMVSKITGNLKLLR
ncbi:MAG: DUF2000 domain-containing protein [Negativicutes bacterium]|nr:DUF2000 domain-containing protein [Negativicutes bacterium]